MGFTGKATYSAGASLPELAEDVSDIIGVVSPYETPLLDHLGDAKRAALSTIHEWVESELLPNFDTVNQVTFVPNATDATVITTATPGRFRVGDQVRIGNGREIMLVTAVSGAQITVVRRYGSTPGTGLVNGVRLSIIGNAALEGDDRPDPRFTTRARRRNYTQILTAAVEVSGSMQAARQVAVDDELDWQKQERVRELIRDLENLVINGVAPTANQQGSSTVRRTMAGILSLVTTNSFVPGQGGIPAGGGAGLTDLNEGIINAALARVWDNSSSRIDTIVVNGGLKRRINGFLTANRLVSSAETRFRDLVSLYESDYGVAKVVLSRWVPADTVLLLDSTRIEVLPLAGRSFAYKPQASTGDREAGQVIGEYTLELRNELAHGVIRGLT